MLVRVLLVSLLLDSPEVLLSVLEAVAAVVEGRFTPLEFVTSSTPSISLLRVLLMRADPWDKLVEPPLSSLALLR